MPPESPPNEKSNNNSYQPATWEKIIAYGAGLVVLGLVVFLAIRNKPIADPTIAVLIRIVLSLAVSILGSTIPGFLHVGMNAPGLTIRAGGAFALFVISFFFTPHVFTSLKLTSTTVLGPNQYPPESIITAWPSPDELKTSSLVAAESVTFSYRNDTEIDLKLFVFDFSKTMRTAPDAFGSPVYWNAWPFPSDGQFRTYNNFRKTNGWFGFALGRFRPDGEALEVTYLQTENIFYSKNPSLIVSASDSNGTTFEATFGERSER